MDTDPNLRRKSGLSWIWWAVAIPLVVTILGGLAVEYLKPDKPGSNGGPQPVPAPGDNKQTRDKPEKVLYGPISGKLVWKPSGGVQWQRAGVDVRDCVVQATFFNPHDATSGPWSEALFFRITPDSKVSEYRVAIDSWDGHWAYGYFNEKKEWVGPRSKLPPGLLATKKADRNHLKLVLNGNQGKFFLNGGFVGDLDVSANISRGDVAVGIFLPGYKEEAEVHFEGFRVSELK